MIKEPIYTGLAQSDLDMAGFHLLNCPDIGGIGIGSGDGAVTQLVSGEGWIRVRFDEAQPDANWTFSQCIVSNTVDAAPLNIWPGILTDKTLSGFKLQLSGAPDSANYYLNWNFSGTGGGSAVGGTYAITDTTVSGQNVRIIVPQMRLSGAAVVYCHGTGEVASTFDPITADKTLYMLDALDNGYVLSSGTFHGDTWDNATAQADIEALVAYLVANYGVTKVVLWAQSAGGPLGLLKATQGFTGVTVRGWFGIYPLVDLNTAHSNALLTASVNAAFPAYPTDATGRDPILFAASAYNGLRLRCCESLTDQYAPAAPHGDALVTLASGHATEVTCVHTTGLHGDASNFTQARSDDFIVFLDRCFR